MISPHHPQTTGLFAGTFDPITIGHVDIIKRSQALFSRVIVAVNDHHHANGSHKSCLFDSMTRVEMVEKSCAHLRGIKVITYQGLTVELARSLKDCVLIRGLRCARDFEFESQLFAVQADLNINTKKPYIDTIYFRAHTKYQHISSSLVRHLASLQTFTTMVPDGVNEQLKHKLSLT